MRSPGQGMSADPLAQLRRAAAAKTRADQAYWSALEAARAAGASFTAIGQAVGMTRQGARQLLARRR